MVIFAFSKRKCVGTYWTRGTLHSRSIYLSIYLSICLYVCLAPSLPPSLPRLSLSPLFLARSLALALSLYRSIFLPHSLLSRSRSVCLSLPLRHSAPCLSDRGTRRCESGAQGLQGVSLNSKSEQSRAVSFCNKALARLQGSDRELPQVGQ
jgi:hypothetical protein